MQKYFFLVTVTHLVDKPYGGGLFRIGSVILEGEYKVNLPTSLFITAEQIRC
jgi:hypothetical protein